MTDEPEKKYGLWDMPPKYWRSPVTTVPDPQALQDFLSTQQLVIPPPGKPVSRVAALDLLMAQAD